MNEPLTKVNIYYLQNFLFKLASSVPSTPTFEIIKLKSKVEIFCKRKNKNFVINLRSLLPIS